MKLPQTDILTLEAPFEIPLFKDSYYWAPCIDFNTGNLSGS